MSTLDAHVREMVRWHFSPETGAPFWCDWASERGLDPIKDIGGFDDLRLLGRFQDRWLRDEPIERFVPRAYRGRPFHVFETGGTTGMPKQRPSWEDHKRDYEAFSAALDDQAFPPGAAWLSLGPTGPRRLRLAIEHLAHHRGGVCYFVDLDPRWVRRLQSDGRAGEVRAYTDHVISQAVTLLEHRDVACLFATPTLLEALDQALPLKTTGIRGVFLGGTSMTAQTVRFLVEEVLGDDIALIPTYGNTLMGLATGPRPTAEDGYALTYFAPEPHAVLRVVDPADPDRVVDYGERGQVELTTLTPEFFLPRFLERDEATRCRPQGAHPWDGVGDVRPLGGADGPLVEGVY